VDTTCTEMNVARTCSTFSENGTMLCCGHVQSVLL
jgi:hypothetical protein